MSPYKCILIAVETSKEAKDILAKAIAVNTQSHAKLILLTVGDLPIPPYSGPLGDGFYVTADSQIDIETIKKQLHKEMTDIAEQHGLDSNHIVIEFGRPQEQILAVAERESADLIVLGSHGRHGIGLLLGSTANAVLHRAKCDILAVRIKEKSEV